MKRRNLSSFLGASERTPDGYRFVLPLPNNPKGAANARS